MKRALPLILLPLILSPGPAMAQTESPSLSEKSAQTTAISTPSDSASQPSIIPLKGTDQIQLRLVNCSWILDCALANLLLPDSTRISEFQLQFDNPAPMPAQVLNTATVIQGDLTGYQLTKAISIEQTGAQTLAANEIISLPLTLNRFAMPPDQYSGAVYLTLAHQTNRLVLPVNLRVRRGPLLPLIILFTGVILGRLFRYMQEQGDPQVEARKKVYQLEAAVKEAHPDDQKLLAHMVKKALNLVYWKQLEAANTQVTAVEMRLDILTKLRPVETLLRERAEKGTYVPDKVFEQITQIRFDIEQEKDAEAKETLDQVLAVLKDSGARAKNDPEMEKLSTPLSDATSSLNPNARSLAQEPRQPNWIDQLQRVMSDLFGLSNLVSAEATYWFVRPLLYGVLLIGLVFVGLNTLYIEQGESFGARPSDYLGLLLWGLSADVASRSLSGLQEQKE